MELRCEYERAKTLKPKGVIHWVAGSKPGAPPPTMEARLYDLLFMSEDPNAIKGDWLADMNPESEVVIKGAFASPVLALAKPGETFQLERLGYFCVDIDSTPGHLVRAVASHRPLSLRRCIERSLSCAAWLEFPLGNHGGSLVLSVLLTYTTTLRSPCR